MPDNNGGTLFDSTSYLCFEGGGGKGLVYLGVIQALEELLGNKGPVFPIHKKVSERYYKGISGTSAGSITAFFLAMGLSAAQVEDIFNDLSTAIVDTATLGNNKTISVSPFESFLGYPDPDRFRAITGSGVRDGQYKSVPPVGALSLIAGAAKTYLRAFKKRTLESTYLLLRLTSNTSGYFKAKENDTSAYLRSLLGNRGLFSGIEVRKFFQKIMKQYLFERLPDVGINLATITPPEDLAAEKKKVFADLISSINEKVNKEKYGEITFREFFFLTGVDLVLTGTNISRGRSFYFSAYHTPEFQVTEAVGISMTFPIVFKPVWIDGVDPLQNTQAFSNRWNEKQTAYYYRDYKKQFSGLYVDGGVLQNFPLHAFDHLKKLNWINKNESMGILTVIEPQNEELELSTHIPYGNNEFQNNVVAFAPVSPSNPKSLKEQEFPAVHSTQIGSLIGELVDTFMSPGGDGQVSSLEERQHVIDVKVYMEGATGPNDYQISLLDFATPQLDKKRAQEIPALRKVYEERARKKEEIITQAKKESITELKVKWQSRYIALPLRGFKLSILFLLSFSSAFAQKYYTGFYQTGGGETELLVITSEVENYYSGALTYLRFSSLSEKVICDFVYGGDFTATNPVGTEYAPPSVQAYSKNNLVSCVNKIFSSRFKLPNGDYYSGPFYAIDSNLLFATGNFYKGYLIDTLKFINYALNFKLAFASMDVRGNKSYRHNLEEVTGLGEIYMKFKKIRHGSEDYIFCTNMAYAFFIGEEKYYYQVWSVLEYPFKGENFYVKSFVNGYLSLGDNKYLLIGSGQNSSPAIVDIFNSSKDYRHYELQDGEYLRLDTKELPYNLYVGVFANSWYSSLSVIDKRESRQSRINNAFYEKSKGISVFVDSNNHILGAIQKPNDGTAIQYFPDSTYKGPELRFRREDESGAVFYLMLKDFKPLQPKIIKINDMRELLATPKDFWGCKSCVEQE